MDIEGARKEGYTDMEIAAEMAARAKFDFDGAIREGYSPAEIIDHLNSSVVNKAKALGQGAAEGVAGLVGMPGDITEAMSNKLGVKPTLFGAIPLSPPTSKQLLNAVGADHVPQGQTNKLLADVGRGASSFGVGGGAAGLMRRILFGAAAGTSGGLTERAVGGDSALMNLVGQAPFLASDLWIRGKKPQAVKATQDYVKEVGEPAMREGAEAAARGGSALGTQILMPQGLENKGALSGLLQEIMRSPQGGKVRKVLERQVPVGQDKIDELLESMGPYQQKSKLFTSASGLRIAKPLEDGSADDIAMLAASLGRDKHAFPQMMKQHLANKLKEATGTVEGRFDAQTFERFAVSVAGSPGTLPGRQKREAFLEGIKQVATAQGKSKEEIDAAAKGASDLMDALLMISRDRGAVGQVAVGGVRRGAGETAPSRILRMANLIAPTQTVGGALAHKTQAMTYEKLADAFTSPTGVDKLVDIARWSTLNNRVPIYLEDAAKAGAAAGEF